MTARFGTKAETLARLQPLLRSATILPQYAFSVSDWRARPEQILTDIRRQFAPARLIVRSSALDEDGILVSSAGRYASVLAVDSGDPGSVRRSVEAVVDSYQSRVDDGRAHQVLVQPQLEAVAVAGVVCTRDVESGAPYYVVNYDDHSGRTDTVTSGTGRQVKTLLHSRSAPKPPADERLARVLSVVRELERLLDTDRLDVEFGVAPSGDVIVFQVRSLAAGHPAGQCPDDEVGKQIEQVHAKLTELSGPHPYLHGTRSVFGVMPDWNPAEIIGVRPRRLALTLYKELVTDAIWAYQRDNYGYRNLRSFPLMVTLAGLPYIDVRVSFNSFVPAELQEDLAGRLVNWYVDRLTAIPASHDKVEFDVVFSCYTFDLDDRLQALAGPFTQWELGDLRSALRRLTNRIIDPVAGLYKGDLAKIMTLEARRARVLDSGLDAAGKFYWLLEDCKRYGTLPFAGLARAGFIAVQLLRSMVAAGIFSQADHDACLASMQTVARRLSRDLARVRRGTMERAAFLSVYGHLRPGTYDLLSKRYDEDPDRYLGAPEAGAPGAGEDEPAPFTLSNRQRTRINEGLQAHGITVDADGLLRFIREAIEGREYSKFVFSRSLSDALRLLNRWGASLGFSDDDLSFLDVTTLLKLYSGSALPDTAGFLREDIARGRAMYEVTQRLRLPPLICDPADVFSFVVAEGTPTFITQRRVTAETVRGASATPQSIRGRIVLIESADPGYDWMFGHGIAGLVTMYGGSNSHMAIRTAELGIPAVIGCGEPLYRRLSQARRLEIDAASRRVQVLG